MSRRPLGPPSRKVPRARRLQEPPRPGAVRQREVGRPSRVFHGAGATLLPLLRSSSTPAARRRLRIRPPPPRLLQIEAHRPVLPPEWKPDPAVQAARGSLKRPTELLRIVALLEGETPALVRRELREFLAVLLHQREELSRQPVLQLTDRNRLEL